MKAPNRQRAISLVETTIALLVMSIAAGALTPVASRMIRKQKLARARRDTEAIRDAILLLVSDVKAGGLAVDGSLPLGRQAPVLLAVSDGDIPALGPEGDADWLAPVDFESVDFLENHLSRNQPGGDPDRGYRNWRGTYLLGSIGPDPWGNRYMVNSVYLWTPDGHCYETVVLSAGPDEEVDTRFTQDGFIPGDDDIVAVVSTGKAFDPPGGPPGNRPPGNRPPGNRPPGNRPPGNRPPGNRPPGNRPPGNRPPGNRPPGNRPPDNRPPGNRPPGNRPPGSD